MQRVSIVIPCYDHGEYLGESVDSALAQTYGDFEIIIVNDGSTDTATKELLNGFTQPKIRVIHSANCGVSSARNRGIREASGKYILPLDADDRIAPTYLERAVAVLDKRPEVGIVYCRAELFGEVLARWVLPEFSLPHMLLDNLIFSAALFRRHDWQLVNGYCQNMRQGWEDWDFWLRILELGKEVVRLPEELFFYRIRHDSRDRSLSLTQKLVLMARLIANHPSLYLRNSAEIVRILLSGSRRRPATIKVPL